MTSFPLASLLWPLLLAINILTFVAFGLDKGRTHGAWRIAERTLLGLALIGGTGGAYLGRWRFRHKTRKRSFSAALHLIALLQVAFLIWFVMRP